MVSHTVVKNIMGKRPVVSISSQDCVKAFHFQKAHCLHDLQYKLNLSLDMTSFFATNPYPIIFHPIEQLVVNLKKDDWRIMQCTTRAFLSAQLGIIRS